MSRHRCCCSCCCCRCCCRRCFLRLFLLPGFLCECSNGATQRRLLRVSAKDSQPIPFIISYSIYLLFTSLLNFFPSPPLPFLICTLFSFPRCLTPASTSLPNIFPFSTPLLLFSTSSHPIPTSTYSLLFHYPDVSPQPQPLFPTPSLLNIFPSQPLLPFSTPSILSLPRCLTPESTRALLDACKKGQPPKMGKWGSLPMNGQVRTHSLNTSHTIQYKIYSIQNTHNPLLGKWGSLPMNGQVRLHLLTQNKYKGLSDPISLLT